MNKIDLQHILFLDIETVSGVAKYEELNETMQNLWADKTKWQRKEEISPEDFYNERAGILAEFGKIVCISVGFIHYQDGMKNFRLRSFYNHDEAILLGEFSEMLKGSYFNHPRQVLCGHNSKEFDIPYICRRMLINGISLPPILQIAGKKPWEIQHLDTMELWKFGDYKHFTSIKLLCALFNIPTPKDDIDGSMVSSVYWNENDLKRIAKYCEKDVLATAQIFMKYRNEDLIREDQVSFSF
jgi:DNA polymerase elongation subunit (family B)